MKKIQFVFIITGLFFITVKKVSAQNDLWKANPTNEFGLIYSQGSFSPYTFIDDSAKAFSPLRNKSQQIGFVYSRYINPKMKLSARWVMGKYTNAFPFSLDTTKFPGTGNMFPSNIYNTTLKAPEQYFGTIGLDFEYKLLQLKRRHQLWLTGGIDLVMMYGTPSISDSIPHNGNYTKTVEIKPWTYQEIHPAFGLGLKYAFAVSPSHTLTLGLKARLSASEISTGSYTLMPGTQVASTGIFYNRLNYIGFSAGYSFNNRKAHSKWLRKRNLRDKDGDYFNDSLISKWELEVGLQYVGIYPNLGDVSGVRVFKDGPGSLARFNILLRKYLKPDFGVYSGINFQFENRTFFSKGPYSLGFANFNRIGIPLGLTFQKPLTKRWSFTLNTELYGFVNLNDPSSDFTIVHPYGTTSSQFTNFRRFGFGAAISAGFTSKLNDYDKIYIGFKYSYDFTPTIDLKYKISDINGSGSSGLFRYMNQNFSFNVSYIFTFKKQRKIDFSKEDDL